MAESLVIECGAGHAYVVVAEGCQFVNQVAVSMLNYQSAQSSIASIQSLLVAAKSAIETCHLEIFISDNASNAEDQRQLQQALEEMPTVNLRINDMNLGFSAGHNRNLKAIFSGSSADYIWILNNDCLVDETTLSALVESAQYNPEVGIWGATLLESDGQTIQCAGGCFYNTWVSSYRQYGHGKHVSKIDQLKSVEYDYIAGASLFFPVATLKCGLQSLIEPEFTNDRSTVQQQWLNESFFLYFEELDLAKRLKPGVGTSWCRDALIVHKAGASTGTSDNQRSALAEYHSTLSALVFTRQYYPRRLCVMAPIRYLSKCLLLILRGDFKLIVEMTNAYRDFWHDLS